MRLLVFKVNQLGDAVVFVPVLQQFRRLWPDAQITLWATPATLPLYGGRWGTSDVHGHDRDGFNGLWRRPGRLLGLLRAGRSPRPAAALVSYDQGSVAHLIARASGARFRIGSGALRIRAPHGLTHPVQPPEPPSIARWNWEMGRAVAQALGRGDAWPTEPAPPDLSHLVQPVRPGNPSGPMVIHAGASRSFRQWPLERFAALAGHLASLGRVAWVERPETAAVPLPPEVERVACPTTADLVRLLATSRLFVGNNSGPMHVAAALGRPGVVISGPTHPHWDPAWWPERWTVLRTRELACLPCESLQRAPTGCENQAAPHACLAAWSVTAVAEACRQRLAAWENPSAPNASSR